MSLVTKTISKLEDHTTYSTDVYILQNLSANFKSRIRDGFYGFKVKQSLKKLSQSEQTFLR
jgi:hypothetical protein